MQLGTDQIGTDQKNVASIDGSFVTSSRHRIVAQQDARPILPGQRNDVVLGHRHHRHRNHRHLGRRAASGQQRIVVRTFGFILAPVESFLPKEC